jgi:hypothetical protein
MKLPRDGQVGLRRVAAAIAVTRQQAQRDERVEEAARARGNKL